MITGSGTSVNSFLELIGDQQNVDPFGRLRLRADQSGDDIAKRLPAGGEFLVAAVYEFLTLGRVRLGRELPGESVVLANSDLIDKLGVVISPSGIYCTLF
jgi:hypothetical protein